MGRERIGVDRRGMDWNGYKGEMSIKAPGM
jgi:hypothetical protein